MREREKKIIPDAKFHHAKHFYRQVLKFSVSRNKSLHPFRRNCDFHDCSKPSTFQEEQFRPSVHVQSILSTLQLLAPSLLAYILKYTLKLIPNNSFIVIKFIEGIYIE